LKIPNPESAGRVTQVVKHLPSKNEALDSTLATQTMTMRRKVEEFGKNLENQLKKTDIN
jgi:hypothetical protein